MILSMAVGVAMVGVTMWGLAVMVVRVGCVIVLAHGTSISARTVLFNENVIMLQNAENSARQRLDTDSLA